MPRGRPPRVNRPQDKTISLPAPLIARVDLELWSDLEAKVPFGAWSKLIEELLTAWLAGRKPYLQPSEGKRNAAD